MRRRTLLALLGLGSAGGAAAWVTKDDLPLEVLVEGQQQTTPNKNEGRFSEWGSELQSELNDTPAYGEVSFATETETMEVDNDAQISTVTVEPTASDGDFFQFTATGQDTVPDVANLVAGTIRLSSELEFTATLDGAKVSFTGGESSIGSFAGATGTHPDDAIVYLVRASDVEAVADRANSVDS